MTVINVSNEPRLVCYDGEDVIVEPGDEIDINPFKLEGLERISALIRQGIFVIYDDEDDEERPSKSKPKLSTPSNSRFKNINFNNEIDDF